MKNFKDNKFFLDFIKRGKVAFSKRGPKDPIFRFWDNVYSYVELVSFINNKSTDKKIKNSANKNYIVNLVTASEIYFKDVLRLIPTFERVKKDNFSGVEELLREKTVTLDFAYELFRRNMRIKIGDILAAGYIFENLETVNNVFSRILRLKKDDKSSFLSKVGEYKPNYKEWKTFQDFFETKNFCLNNDVQNWRQTLTDLFEKRHEYVHDICLNDKLTYKELTKYWWALMYLIYAVDMFIRDKYL